MQLVAESYEKKATDKGESLKFNVKNVNIQKDFDGTKFTGWSRFPYSEGVMDGTVTLTLDKNIPVLYMEYEYNGHYSIMLDYIRGPWVKVGQGSFGVAKDEALMPGMDWVEGGEWSSGQCFWREPWRNMSSPMRNKIAIPIMAVSHAGTAVSLAWDNNDCHRSYTAQTRYNQPVFASPNYIERDDDHLLGLMYPSPVHDIRENRGIEGDTFNGLCHVKMHAQLALSEGTVTQAVVDYVKRTGGLPQIENRRYEMEEGLHRIARAYDEIYWKGEEWKKAKHVPQFIEPYVKMFPDNATAKSLAAKAAKIGGSQVDPVAAVRLLGESTIEIADNVLARITPEGFIGFDPNGIHPGVDYQIIFGHLDPLGQPGDPALDLSTQPVLALLRAWEETKDDKYKQGAKRLLDYFMDAKRPEGGDFWETPLHAANLFAAGHAMNAYGYWYKLFGGEEYKDKAVYWLRTLLAFTHLWEPEGAPMLYFTKPCLCPSDYYHANWVVDHVQWEVLASFGLSYHIGLDWNELDPEIDWELYQEGITNAAFYWMVVRGEPITELWHNFDDSVPDYYYADAHGTTSLMFSGGPIGPDSIALNAVACLERG